MRVLFVPAINRSQTYTMTPLAWAMRTAGHQVRFASQPELAEHIASIGLTPAPVGQSMASLKKDMEEAEPQQDPVAPVTDPLTRARSAQSDYGWGDPVATQEHLTWEFYKLLNPDSMIEGLIEYAQRWRPDLIVWNTLAFAGPVAARVSGAAHVRMPWAVDAHAQIRAGFLQARAAQGSQVDDPLEKWLGPFLSKHGAQYDDEIAVGQYTITQAPPWIYHPAGAGVTYVPMRPVPFNGPSMVPDWVHEPPTRKRVCLTLGISNREGHGVETSTRDLLEAVADLDVEVVATFNERQIGGASGLPDNVRLVDFVPLSVLLPTCSAIVHHGGPGSFATSLEHGVPQLIVNGTYWHVKYWGSISAADGLEAQGAGVHVADGDTLTPEVLRKQLLRVLEDPSYARNAERLRSEAQALPSPNEVVHTLERLTAEHHARKGRVA